MWLSKLLHLQAGCALKDSFVYFMMAEYSLAPFERTIVFTECWCQGRPEINLIILQTRNAEHGEINFSKVAQIADVKARTPIPVCDSSSDVLTLMLTLSEAEKEFNLRLCVIY